MKALLEARNVSKTYGRGHLQVVALQNVFTTLFAGECVALMGPSGSGKSTLLSILGLISRPTTGEVLVQGKVAPSDERSRARLRNRFFGYVHQEFAIIENESVERNVVIPLQYSSEKIKRQERRKRVQEVLSQVGLAEALHKNASHLSGGERQRVAIARALINNPSVILADEPTAALDGHTAQEIMQLLLSFKERGALVLVATHDERVVNRCDRVLRILDGNILESFP
ncbi:MAG: ABC transporter ATP-binding protein [Gammaproteobacteria bacterium]|nr:MAG: ABC transporter ATP-binding protein [Gammaproteobacteria bacterium]